MSDEYIDPQAHGQITPVCSTDWLPDFLGNTSERPRDAPPQLAPRLPTEIFEIIVEVLHANGAQATLASLLCVKHLRELAAPKLYGTIRIATDTIARLLVGLPRATADTRRQLVKRSVVSSALFRDHWPNCPCPSDDDSDIYDEPPQAESGTSIAPTVLARLDSQATDQFSKRKRILLSLTRMLVVVDVPPTRYCADLLYACSIVGASLLMPRVVGVQLCAHVQGQFRIWPYYNKLTKHPLARALERLSRPSAICIDYALKPTQKDYYEAHKPAVARLGDPELSLILLRELPYWDSLAVVTHHNIPPTILGSYPAPNVVLYFDLSVDYLECASYTISDILCSRPKRQIHHVESEPRPPRSVTAHFPIPAGTNGQAYPEIAWEKELSIWIYSDMRDEDLPQDPEQIDEQKMQEDLRRLRILRTAEGELCECCGRR